MKLRFFFVFLLLGFLTMLGGCAATGTQATARFIDLHNGIFQLPGSNLMWQKERSPLFTSKEEALAYVRNLRLGGYSDWRLPTPDEVLALHNAEDFGQAKEGDAGIYLAGNYWCVLANDDVMAGSWQDGMACEIRRTYQPHLSSGHVRAVRP